MNLPLKLVDLVTLLFLSLLVVIIVFISLQRNIKRFKRRNDKDSHFLSCKSIPKDIKEAIERKHTLSNKYKEPPYILSESDLKYQDDKAKTYIIRMKAFEVAKYLEKALIECGYKRLLSVKLEDFIDGLVENNSEDKSLPKSLLNDFVSLYVWAMHDPMPFTNQDLSKLNLLINKILDQLATNKKDISDNIRKYKLDLDSNGNYDFNKYFIDKDNLLDFNMFNSNNNNNITNNTFKMKPKTGKKETFNGKTSKEIFQVGTSSQIASGTNSAIASEIFELQNMNVESDNDYTDNFTKSNSKKKILNSINNNNNNNNNKSKKLFHKKSSNSNESSTINTSESATAISSSFAIGNQSRIAKDKKNKTNKYEEKNLIDDSLENINLIEAKIDCSLANDSIKTIFDSENEEIPLVGTSCKKSSYHKKKNSHSSIILLNQKIKNQSTPPLKIANVSNIHSTTINTNNNPSIAPTISSSNSVTVTGDIIRFGEENEGFNETGFG